MVKKEAVLHINTEDFIYPVERNRLTVRLRAARDDLTKCLIVYFSRTTPDQKKDCQLVKLYSDDLFDYYVIVNKKVPKISEKIPHL